MNASKPSVWARLARGRVLAALGHLRLGEITLIEGSERTVFGAATPEFPQRASLIVHDPRFWLDLALGGNVGSGESYVAGRWSSDDLPTLLRIAAANEDAAARLVAGWARLRAPLERLAHALRRNDPPGSRRNIEAHYDLGNDFFALFLDPTFMYSCAVFPREDASLEEASLHKLERVCDELGLGPGMRVLEIGGGWGGFALHAARTRGCEVVTTTVSPAQYRFAVERVRAAGLASRITVLAEDYRRLPAVVNARFDALVSLEMIEAVGHRYLPEFFRVCGAMLAPGAPLLLQSIVIPDPYYAYYRKSVDFIRKHVFPGGHLPCPGALHEALAEAPGLRVERQTDLTPHYPRTLSAWSRRLREHRADAHALGYSERFLRLWEYYFAYCEGGFLARAILVTQWRLRAQSTAS